MNRFLTLGFIAGAAVLMGSCAKDVENSGFSQNAIEFGTYLGRDAQTKGAITSLTSIQTSGFGVTAFYTGQTAWTEYGVATAPNFMYNQKVEYSNDAWSYSPVKYWPTMNGDKISFFAYAPYNAAGIALADKNATAANTSLTFTVQDAANMVDFVAGVQLDKTHNNETSKNNKVEFSLKHELTRVGIFAKVNNDVYKEDGVANKTFVVIKSVKLDGATANNQFYSSAKYTFANENGNDKRGTWSDQQGATTDFDLSNVLKKETITAIGAVSGDYKTGVNGIKLTGKKQVSLFKDKEFLFLIPVTAAGSTSSEAINATATISYDIVTEDSKLAAGYSCTSATKTVSLPAGTLVQGKAYNYVFTINVDEVKLSATVTDWENATDGNATDGNVTVDYASIEPQA